MHGYQNYCLTGQRGHGRTQVNTRSTYAPPGMHMQQCSAVPNDICVLHRLIICTLGGPLLCPCGCRALSTTSIGLHLNYTGQLLSIHLTLHYRWHLIGHKSVEGMARGTASAVWDSGTGPEATAPHTQTPIAFLPPLPYHCEGMGCAMSPS